MLFYAIVAYGLVLTLKQSLTLAAAEGARAAVQDAPSETTRLDRAKATANGVLSWVPQAGVTVNAAAAPCAANPATTCVTVTVSYDYAGHPIVPALPLLGIAIPANLGASATVQL
jgi:Flp pilus assembly protein TadG